MGARQIIPKRLIGSVKSTADLLAAWLVSPAVAVMLGEVVFRLMGFRASDDFPRLEDIRSVLVVRVDQIGDVVLSSPLLRELRRSMPAAKITLVVNPIVRQLVEKCPYVDNIETFDPARHGRFPMLRRHWRAFQLSRKRLWRARFDLAVAPRWNKDMYHALFVCYLSGARWRIAYEQPVDHYPVHSDLNQLLTHVLNGTANVLHEVDRNLEFLKSIDIEIESKELEVWVDDTDMQKADAILEQHGVEHDDSFVVVAPGAGERKKVWPVNRFRTLVTWLVENIGVTVVIVGNETDRALGKRLVNGEPKTVINIAGRLNLREVAALLDRSVLFIGNDSGPMHIAAARKIPVVDISSHPATASDHRPMSPKRFGPWNVPHKVVRPVQPTLPCKSSCIAPHAHCIRSITAEEVISVTALFMQEMKIDSSITEPKTFRPIA